MQRIQVIDSHTGGEPTRVVIAGGPSLGDGPLRERRDRFRDEFDSFRSAIVNEPRGSDVLVGALLLSPYDPTCDAGVIFFNNTGTIGMCGHGAIGVVRTLQHLERPLPHGRLETPVGIVSVTSTEAGGVSITNVPSYRTRCQIEVNVPGLGSIRGDVAYGGNWFFLTEQHGQQIAWANCPQLTRCASDIRHALAEQGITGENGVEIDHVELFGPTSSSAADSRNFVLCPGGAFDRSPCGTGTSAKLACLIADGKLQPGDLWRQESITGSIFTATGQFDGERVIPTITGQAFITAESTLLLDADDPWMMGIRS